MIGSTVNIFLIEDNEVDQEAIKRAFRKEKIANPFITASDGIEALEKLRGGEVPAPYLILLDLNMPRMDGIEFLGKLRQNADHKGSIVFVLTTSRSDEDKVEAYNLNVAGYMVKSDVGAGFIKLVEMLDHYWRVVEFPPVKK